MPHESSWPIIRGAAAGGTDDRREFVRRYLGVIRTYLAARWQGSDTRAEIDDAVQDVFVECFRENGALQGIALREGDDFRVYLRGVVRNVARRIEGSRTKRQPLQSRSSVHFSQLSADETSLSQVFDRAWARNIMRQAAVRQRELAKEQGGDAMQRVELLQLRFHRGLPIREIAKLWEIPPARLHHEYARAREEFRDALLQVVGLQRSCGASELQAEIDRLLISLVR